jgi:hypothetical protein
MQDIQCHQLKQISGGVILGPSAKPDEYILILMPTENFYFVNATTGTRHMFFDDGVVFQDGAFTDSSQFSPYFSNENCVYRIPATFFSF